MEVKEMSLALSHVPSHRWKLTHNPSPSDDKWNVSAQDGFHGFKALSLRQAPPFRFDLGVASLFLGKPFWPLLSPFSLPKSTRHTEQRRLADHEHESVSVLFPCVFWNVVCAISLSHRCMKPDFSGPSWAIRFSGNFRPQKIALV